MNIYAQRKTIAGRIVWKLEKLNVPAGHEQYWLKLFQENEPKIHFELFEVHPDASSPKINVKEQVLNAAIRILQLELEVVQLGLTTEHTQDLSNYRYRSVESLLGILKVVEQ